MSAVNGSVSNIWTVPLPPAPAEETVVNDSVNLPINTTIRSEPYNFLAGVPGSGTQIAAGAAAVAPITDGETEYSAPGTSGAPSDLGSAGAETPSALDPSVFENWTSMQQSEYLNYWIVKGQVTNYSAIIGATSGSSTPPITVVLSQSVSGMVYIVNNLQKTDFASMSLADQKAVAGTAYFQNTLATQVGLTSDVTSAVANIDAQTATIFGNQTTVTVNSNGTTTTTTTTMSPDGSTSTTTSTATSAAGAVAGTVTSSNTMSITTPTGPVTINNMPAADVQVFVDELNMLKAEVNNQAVVSPTDVATQVQAIDTRFQRAAAFWTQDTSTATPFQFSNAPSSAPPTGLYYGVVSEDKNASIASAYSTFINQEKQVLAIQQDGANVAATGMVGTHKADVPTLLLYFQMDADLAQEAEITADTEEVQQLNTLLQTYSDMQTLLNQTLKQFTSADTSTTDRGLSGSTGAAPLNSTPPPLTTQQLTVASMFDSNLGSSDPNLATAVHPLELLFGITRPTQDMFRDNAADPMPGYTQTQWNAFGTQLSNGVTSLQQQSQILTNQITEETKEKDNHFDIANSAVSKMYDTVQQIARGLA